MSTRAWLSAGAPIVLLVLAVTALCFYIVLNFAHAQDEDFERNSHRLIESALGERMRAVENQAWDDAVWDDAYANITRRWNQDWIDNNFYTDIADGVVIFNLSGRHARNVWLGETYSESSDNIERTLLSVARDAIRSRPVRRADERGISSGYFLIGDQLAAFAVTAIQPASRRLDARLPVDYVAIVEIFDPAEIAAIGGARNLDAVRFEAGAAPDGAADIGSTISSSDGRVLGRLVWTNTHPGSAAFASQMWPIVLALFMIGAITVAVVRRLVQAQIAAASRAETALESGRMRAEFIAAMSHELRTPLNSIIGYGELIKEDAAIEGFEAIEHDADSVLKSAKHLLQLVNDVIDHSRLDAGRLQMTIENLPVAGVLAAIEEFAAPLARTSSNSLTIADAAPGREVQGDEVRVTQCLMNLVSNASKYTHHGAISVSARLEQRGGRDFVVFDVADTGVGMSEAVRRDLFKPFAQLHSGTQKYAGAGLGLSITHKLARAMGGDISVDSEIGKGSLFSLALPAAPVQRTEAGAGGAARLPHYA